MRTAVQIQIKELDPEIHNLRLLRNEINEMEMESGKLSGAFDKEPEESDHQQSSESRHTMYLVQKYTKLSGFENSMGRPPTVVKYSKSS